MKYRRAQQRAQYIVDDDDDDDDKFNDNGNRLFYKKWSRPAYLIGKIRQCQPKNCIFVFCTLLYVGTCFYVCWFMWPSDGIHDLEKLWKTKQQRLSKFALPPIAVCNTQYNNHSMCVNTSTYSYDLHTDVMFVIHDSRTYGRRKAIVNSVGYGKIKGVRFHWFSASDKSRTFETRGAHDGVATLLALREARRTYPKVKWFVKGDDDSYFFVENVMKLLNSLDASDVHYLGFPLLREDEDFVYASGGAGYIYSMAGIDTLMKSHCWKDITALSMYEDINAAVCGMQSMPPIRLTPVYGFFPFTSDTYICGERLLARGLRSPGWYARNCLGNIEEAVVPLANPPLYLRVQPISRHYLQPEMIRHAPDGVVKHRDQLALDLIVYTRIQKAIISMLKDDRIPPIYMFTPRAKFIVFQTLAHKSIAENLMAIVSCFMLAIVTERAFILQWTLHPQFHDIINTPLQIEWPNVPVHAIPLRFKTNVHTFWEMRRKYITESYKWKWIGRSNANHIIPEEVLVVRNTVRFGALLQENPWYNDRFTEAFGVNSFRYLTRWLLRPRTNVLPTHRNDIGVFSSIDIDHSISCVLRASKTKQDRSSISTITTSSKFIHLLEKHHFNLMNISNDVTFHHIYNLAHSNIVISPSGYNDDVIASTTELLSALIITDDTKLYQIMPDGRCELYTCVYPVVPVRSPSYTYIASSSMCMPPPLSSPSLPNVGIMMVVQTIHMKHISTYITSASQYLTQMHLTFIIICLERDRILWKHVVSRHHRNVVFLDADNVLVHGLPVRFHAYLSMRYEIQKRMHLEYVYVTDIDTEWVDTVGAEILSDSVATVHPLLYTGNHWKIPMHESLSNENDYWTITLYGGHADQFFDMMNHVVAAVNRDIGRFYQLKWNTKMKDIMNDARIYDSTYLRQLWTQYSSQRLSRHCSDAYVHSIGDLEWMNVYGHSSSYINCYYNAILTIAKHSLAPHIIQLVKHDNIQFHDEKIAHRREETYLNTYWYTNPPTLSLSAAFAIPMYIHHENESISNEDLREYFKPLNRVKPKLIVHKNPLLHKYDAYV